MEALQLLVRQAYNTFKPSESSVLMKNIENLRHMMNSITCKDIHITPRSESSFFGKILSAPVSYTHLFESQYVTMGVFHLNNKESALPLHDHPGMHGLLKVLYGKVRIRSFDPLIENDGKRNLIQDLPYGETIKCTFAGEQILDENSNPIYLSPISANCHSIEPCGGPAAFLDILAPPYAPGNGRDCTYFRECSPMDLKNANITIDDTDSETYLMKTPAPRTFYTDTEPYRGPPIKLEN